MSGLAEVIEAALASDEAQIVEMMEKASGISVPANLRGNLVYPAAQIVAAHVAEWLLADEQVEKAARALAGIEPGDDWPSNAQLGGNPTGTRDDEYRFAMREEARDLLAAVAGDDDA